jgi:beta-N-acetylhexosaminidase
VTVPKVLSGVRQPALLLPRGHTVNQQAAQLVAHMSLDDKLGQLIIMQFTDKTYTPMQRSLVVPFHPGGVILYTYAMGTHQQILDMLGAAQRDSPIPMFTFLDLEGGYVDRLQPYLGYRLSAGEMAATGKPSVAESEGARVARDMLSFGLNVDIAPDVDVALVDGPDLGDRTFGSDPKTVVAYAGAWLQGLQSHGVIGTLKHFPGLGDAKTDAHTSLPLVNRTRAELEATEFAPYRALIAAGQVHMIMATDELVPALDPNWASELSRPTITGVLRDELHYDGVVITDGLYMDGVEKSLLANGIHDTFPQSFADAAVLAIEAGDDMVLAPWAPDMMRDIEDSLKQAIANGALSMAQVDTSVRRILALKIMYHLLRGPAAAGTGPYPEPLTDADLPRRRPA